MMTEQEHNNVQWRKVRFDQFFDMLPTNTLSRDKLNNQQGEYQNIHYGDVLIKYPFCLDCNNAEIPYINDGVKFNMAEVRDGDVIFADTAEDDTVGKCVEVLNVGDRKIVSGLHTYFCRPRHEMALGYLGYYLNSNHFHNQLLPYIAGSKVSSVNRTSIARTFISYPADLPVQRRIAAILASADKVIDSTRKLIAKYKQMKQGMMEELFNEQCTMNNGEWARKTLIELADYYNGMAFKPSDWENDGTKIIRIEQLNNPLGKYDYYKGCFSETNAIHNGDLIFSWSATLKVVIWQWDDGVLNQHLFKVVPASNVDKHFLYYLLDYNMPKLGESSHGSTMKHIKRKELETYTAYIPRKIAEQKRIASILSSIDSKIECEQSILNKYIQVKKGLMDKLLNK